MYVCLHCGLLLVTQTGGVNVKHGNGVMRERELGLLKKRRQGENSEDEEDSYYGTRITEERYRSMLGEHIQKYNSYICVCVCVNICVCTQRNDKYLNMHVNIYYET